MSHGSDYVCPVGLDPPTLSTVSSLLYRLAEQYSPRVILALRPQDPLPKWITHVIYLDSDSSVAYQGPKGRALREFISKNRSAPLLIANYRAYSKRSRGRKKVVVEDRPEQSPLIEVDSASVDALETGEAWESNEPLVEMKGVEVKYAGKHVLGAWQQDVEGQPKNGLWWTVRRGERWGMFGPNGSHFSPKTYHT